MPLYDMECGNCGTKYEIFLKYSSTEKIVCSSCGTELEKTVSKMNFVLKGNSWAKDGYR